MRSGFTWDISWATAEIEQEEHAEELNPPRISGLETGGPRREVLVAEVVVDQRLLDA